MPRIGLLTGFEPFAGLSSNPSQQVLTQLEGVEIAGVRVVARTLPVSYRRVPAMVEALVGELQPAFVVSLGLALGAPVLRVERLAINVASFSVADSDGAAPDGEAFAMGTGAALRATWDAGAVVDSLLEAGIPAVHSWHAGTHLCNLTLFASLDALNRRGLHSPCGLLHLPYTPEQVAGFLRERPGRPDTAPTRMLAQPSMPLELQARAVRLTLAAVVAEANRNPAASGPGSAQAGQ